LPSARVPLTYNPLSALLINDMAKDYRIVHKTILQQVMENLQHMVASGEFTVGDKIPGEMELAKRFGVGRSSVREAIKIFNYLGVLESKTSQGTFVCDSSRIAKEALAWSILLGKRDLKELIEIRAGIEFVSTMIVTSKADTARESFERTVASLEREVGCMRDNARDKTDPAVMQAVCRFHKAIVDGSERTSDQCSGHCARPPRYPPGHQDGRRPPGADRFDTTHQHHQEALPHGRDAGVSIAPQLHRSMVRQQEALPLARNTRVAAADSSPTGGPPQESPRRSAVQGVSSSARSLSPCPGCCIPACRNCR